MREKHSEQEESKGICYEALEEFAREKIRQHLQYLLEEEITEWLGREKSERKGNALEQPGYRNGYGKTRRFTLSTGTVEIQRPRVRDLGERFVSKVLPFLKRQTKQVRDLIPELYLHGLARGDFELALRGLLGEGAPLSATSLQRLKEKWRNEYEQWKSTPIKQEDWAYCRVPPDSEHWISESGLVIDRWGEPAGRIRWPNRVGGLERSVTRS